LNYKKPKMNQIIFELPQKPKYYEFLFLLLIAISQSINGTNGAHREIIKTKWAEKILQILFFPEISQTIMEA